MKILVIIGLAFLISNCKPQLPGNTDGSGKPFPKFDLQLIDSVSILNTKSLVEKKPIILFVFDPDCNYCRKQLNKIMEGESKLANVKIYMVTFASYNSLLSFYKEFKLERYKNITVGRDTAFFSISYYGLTGVPFIAVYNKEHVLRRTFPGVVDVDILSKVSME